MLECSGTHVGSCSELVRACDCNVGNCGVVL